MSVEQSTSSSSRSREILTSTLESLCSVHEVYFDAMALINCDSGIFSLSCKATSVARLADCRSSQSIITASLLPKRKISANLRNGSSLPSLFDSFSALKHGWAGACFVVRFVFDSLTIQRAGSISPRSEVDHSYSCWFCI